MGLESARGKEKNEAILAQVTLAKLAFGENDHKNAMNQWLSGGEDSLAAHFRKYVEDHPEETIDAKNEPAMRSLLEKIRTYH